MTSSHDLRRKFLAALIVGLQVTWPILSLLIFAIVAAGLMVGLLEGWSIADSLYFSFVTGMTIGYGDLVPQGLFSRILSILIGGCGILLTALIAAVAVKALTATFTDGKQS